MRARAVLGAGVIGAALALSGAASAGQQAAAKVKLALVPLPKAALGSAAKSLTQTRSSWTFGGAGTGEYSLDYGYAFSGKSGVAGIQTSVGGYGTAAGARRGLARARKQEATLSGALVGIAAGVKAVRVPAIGSKHFAELITLRTSGTATVYEVDEEFADHAYILSATVAASSARAAEKLAPVLARKLHARLGLAIAGKLHGTPPKPPRPPAPGPPANGPDLSTLALTAGDFGTATIQQQGYQAPDFVAISEYALSWQPAGTYSAATQILNWCANANEATWSSALYVALFSSLTGASADQITPVDLTAVGDRAEGVIIHATLSSPPSWIALIGLSSGDASDVVIASSQTQLQPSDVQSLAQSAANRLNAGLGG